MRRAQPRTNFNSSRLIRILADLAVADVAESKQPFAERLGEWLDVSDAITLFAALNSAAARTPPARSPVPVGAGVTVGEELARLRAALVESISTDGAARPGRARSGLPMPAADASNAGVADFSPYRRYCLAHQRDMDSRIGSLRADVRAAAARHSPALRQLAALDAVLERALADRQGELLATVPRLLELRFEHLRTAHQAASVATPAGDDTAPSMRPGGWLAVYCADMRRVLLAELDLRLQPVVGLIEALGNEVTRHQ